MKNNRFYVYIYKDLNDKPFYIGKGSGKRSLDHIRYAIHGDDSEKSHIILDILNNTGKYPKIEKVIDNIDDELAYLIEEELILKYGRRDINTGILCNRSNGKEGPPKWEDLSEESKIKRVRGLLDYTYNHRIVDEKYSRNISKGLKLYYKYAGVSDETRKKLSIACSDKRNGMYGKKHSEHSKEKMSKSHMGYEPSLETKQKLSIAGKLRIGENNPFFGKHHSEESKKKKSIKSKAASDNYRLENDGKHWNSGRIITEETREKLTIFRKCPYCGKEGRGSAMNRWHFDNCKYKKENMNGD